MRKQVKKRSPSTPTVTRRPAFPAHGHRTAHRGSVSQKNNCESVLRTMKIRMLRLGDWTSKNIPQTSDAEEKDQLYDQKKYHYLIIT